MSQNSRDVSQNEGSTSGQITYRCNLCRRLLRMELGHGGERCPVCETPGSHLQTVARIMNRMRAESERARGAS